MGSSCVIWGGVIEGQPYSKANARIPRPTKNGRVIWIKSKKAHEYLKGLVSQVPILPELLRGELRADIVIYYRTELPDLDESLILDGLQGRIYKNDRQVREKHVYHKIDKDRPRAEVTISPR